MKSKTEVKGNLGVPGDLLVRILIFSCFILITNFWSLNHLGSKLTQLLVTNCPLALIAIVSFFTKILKDQETENITEKIRGWFFLFLRTPVLIILLGLILVTGSVLSSVTVMSSGVIVTSSDVSDGIAVNLTPEGHSHPKQPAKKPKRLKKLTSPNDIVRFIKFTTPFGRPFYLEVDGYLRYSFDLYPWIGKKIRVTKDLRVSPSLLIRVPVGLQRLLARGKIVVTSDGTPIAERNTDKQRGAILVGHSVPIPNEFVVKWERELSAAGLVERSSIDRSILVWQYPQLVRPRKSTAPGMTVEVRFIIQEKLEFSIDLKFQSDLDSGYIPEDLRWEFEDRNISLSQDATVLVKKKGSEWLIDGIDDKKYLVRKEKRELSIYSEEKLKAQIKYKVGSEKIQDILPVPVAEE